MAADPQKCPRCGGNRLGWTTTKGHVPADVLQCLDCSAVADTEDWIAPVAPLLPGRCVNCGARFEIESCVNCDLTRKEVVQVHHDLRDLVDAKLGFHDAAKEAARVGRKVLALKLATAGAASNDGGRGAQCRAMRIWLLQGLGRTQDALLDARAWVEHTPDPPGLAWAIYGQQMLQTDNKGGAADAFGHALKKDEKQHTLRAKRARLLLDLRREGQATDEAIKLIELKADDANLGIGLGVLEDLAELHEQKHRQDELGRVLEAAKDHLEKSARLMGQKARVAGDAADYGEARKWLKKAKALNPDLDVYKRVKVAEDGEKKEGWWRWSS